LDSLKDEDGQAAPFALVTLHRPANVDDSKTLADILQALQHISSQIPVVFPVHPRTRKKLGELTGPGPKPGLHLTQPIGYLGFLALQQKAAMVMTDSGGIQEETTYLGVPCLTLRENTERPITVTMGTNILVGKDMNRLQAEADKILAGGGKKGQVPELWDGRSGPRIAKIIAG
jgi:UDP-N-acetylglucosamine 2-epimerase (non-hydrolysing)